MRVSGLLRECNLEFDETARLRSFLNDPGGNMFHCHHYIIAIVVGMVLAQYATADVIVTTGAGFAIPDDNAGGATSSIAVGADETISNVEVTLFGLTHTWVGDLTGRITSPSGTTADLFVRVGPGTFGDSSNLDGDYTFADGGANWAATAASLNGNGDLPSATYQPATNGDGAISLAAAFAGESTLGNWTLFLSDGAQFDTGSLGGWGVNISSSVTAVPEPGPFVLVLLTGMALLKRRKRVVIST